MDKTQQNAQNVITMSDFQTETGFTAISQVEAYWEAIRGDRLVPKRSDIDPRGIEQALEHAFIVERIALGVARLRIAGNHLTSLMGMEVRGMPLTTFFTPGARGIVSDLLEEVFQAPSVGRLRMTSVERPDRPTLNAQMILLPLSSDLGDVSRVLGCLVSKGSIGAAPRRFDIVSRKIDRIKGGPDRLPALTSEPSLPAPISPSENAPSGMAETSAGFEHRKQTRRPPYLRLVKSDD